MYTPRQGSRVLTMVDEYRTVHDGVGNALRRRNLSDTFTFQFLVLRQFGGFDHHEVPAFREHSLGAQGSLDIGPELLGIAGSL